MHISYIGNHDTGISCISLLYNSCKVTLKLLSEKFIMVNGNLYKVVMVNGDLYKVEMVNGDLYKVEMVNGDLYKVIMVNGDLYKFKMVNGDLCPHEDIYSPPYTHYNIVLTWQ